MTEPNTDSTTKLSLVEYIALLGLMMALGSLSVDSLLPAFSAIQEDLSAADGNSIQWVISALMLGLAVGQLLFPTLSDSLGRKPCMYAGLATFLVGCGLVWVAQSFAVLLVARVIQGIGLGSARTLTLAMVRDQYEGQSMARVMSLLTAIFVLLPVVAPGMGQLMLDWGNWRYIFLMLGGLGLLLTLWFGVRMPETLEEEERAPLSLKRVGESVAKVFQAHQAVRYILALGLVTAAYFGWLNCAAQVLKEQYDLGDQFAWYMGGLSACVALASLVNNWLVTQLKITTLVQGAALWVLVLALGMGVWLVLAGAKLGLWMVMAYLGVTFLGIGVLFGNLSSLATEPLGEVAGTGSGLVDATATLMGAGLGTLVSMQYQDSLLPIVVGLAIGSGLSLGLLHWAARASTAAA